MKLLKKYADNSLADSPAARLRRKRFLVFRRLLSSVPRPLKVLDIGGTVLFWQMMDFAGEDGLEITILNIQPGELSAMPPVQGRTRFVPCVGDARAMPEFRDGEFDVVFSNSVIEHVGDIADQRRMMSEVRRVGKRYFVQTPNYFWLIEPHFLFPGFQFLPRKAQVFLLRHFELGWAGKIVDRAAAEAVAGSVRLLRESELRELCPEAEFYHEKLFGFTKSFVVYAGW